MVLFEDPYLNFYPHDTPPKKKQSYSLILEAKVETYTFPVQLTTIAKEYIYFLFSRFSFICLNASFNSPLGEIK